jgi:hypothetical protein
LEVDDEPDLLLLKVRTANLNRVPQARIEIQMGASPGGAFPC